MSPLKKIDLGVVLAAGRELELQQAVSVPDFGSFSFPAPAEVALIARRIGDGVELEGTVDTSAAGACARCLDEVRLPIHLDIDERLEPDTDRADPLGDSNVLTGDHLDLEDLIRQLIDSAVPLVLLCSDDCRGLCPSCGKKRDGACRCPQPDPE